MQPQPNIETRKGERLPQTLIGASNHQADQQFQFHSDSSNKQENERMGVGQMEEHIDSTFGVGMYNIEGFLYRDFSGADADTVQRLLNLSNISNRKGPRGGVALPFPLRLSNMLESHGADLNDIVSWQSHGRCFRVHDQKRFVSEVMPRFFQQSMYASFQRQLHLYGFKKVTKGIDIDSFYHELFLRGRPDLSQLMIRNKSKSQGSSDDTKCDIFSSPILNAKIPESNFYSICTNNSSYEVKSRQAISAVPGTLWEGSETWLEESPTLAESSACVKKSHQIETISHLSELHDTTIQVPRSGNDEESTECCTSYDALFPNER